MIADFSEGVVHFFSGYPTLTQAAGFSYLPAYIHNMIHKHNATGMAILNTSSNDNLKTDEIGFLDISEFLNIYAKAGRKIGMEIPMGLRRTEFKDFLIHPNHDKIYNEKCQQIQKDNDSKKWE